VTDKRMIQTPFVTCCI